MSVVTTVNLKLLAVRQSPRAVICESRHFAGDSFNSSYKMELKKLIEEIEHYIRNPSIGLPDEVFYFISRITPLVNVDLLIKNQQGATLLTWREDQFYKGWHIPGGIVRYKETFSERIKEVAKNELGAEIDFDPEPLAINNIIQSYRRDRGHFISILFGCRLTTKLDDKNRCKNINEPKKNEWMWFKRCPKNLLIVHRIYEMFINDTSVNDFK